MKSAILIGASGFLGQHMMQALQEGGYEVHAVVHKRKPGAEGIKLIYGGIKALDHKLIDEIKPDLIIHCARPSFPQLRRYGRYISATMASRLNNRLLIQLRKSSGKPLLVFSSGSLVYGNSTTAHEEKIAVNPISYARQYYRGEKPFTRAANDGTYPIILFRLPWLLGDGSWFKWFYIDPVLKKKSVPVFKEGKNIMEIIDVRDAAELMLNFSSAGNRGIINIPGSVRISQNAFADKVSAVSGTRKRPYAEVFPGKLEKEAIVAFTSNILLKTRHVDEIAKFDFIPLDASLQYILSGKP